ncbi:MAG: type II toxin-antitoxin system Phd/YefM family antitoxin [Anaerolineales bacterium]|nr:type II toxin-antitoxin system Phd/YefM family antitoxin [Chloroflexota bacterium]MBL7161122.1 type II toxin-antitoxin system Phd/YefM family antitoxin [Anaerolineales bacterium]
MTDQINIHQAKTHFSKLLKRVIAGEEIVIAKSGKPIAKIVPLENAIHQRKPGSAIGKVKISPEFDAPLPDDILESFEQ